MSSTFAGESGCPNPAQSGYCAAFGGDMKADPIVNGNGGASPGLVNSGGKTASGAVSTVDYYQVGFAAGPGYPGGYPTPISQAVFVNRIE